MKRISFFVHGPPKGQPRPKARAFAGHAQIYNPKTADFWKLLVSTEARKNIPTDHIAFEAVKFRAIFYFERPLSHFKKDGSLRPTAPSRYGQKPDFDNVAKSTVDALDGLGLWSDDKKITDAHIVKRYVHPGSTTVGAYIEISEDVE